MTDAERSRFSLLANPSIYAAVQSVIGGERTRRFFVENFVRARQGDHVLDVGCGPGSLLPLLPDIKYTGYDPSRSYIDRARKAFGARGRFFVGTFGEKDVVPQAYDIGILSGVLHHLDDDTARALLAAMRAAIKPGGRLVTVDPVFTDDQNFFARKLIERDRGKYVRFSDGYQALTKPFFGSIREAIIHGKLPPYTWRMSDSQ
jgi:SAM-dependent methyltransferase